MKLCVVIEKILSDPETREDVMDAAIALQRRKEKSIPYNYVREELKRSRRL